MTTKSIFGDINLQFIFQTPEAVLFALGGISFIIGVGIKSFEFGLAALILFGLGTLIYGIKYGWFK